MRKERSLLRREVGHPIGLNFPMVPAVLLASFFAVVVFPNIALAEEQSSAEAAKIAVSTSRSVVEIGEVFTLDVLVVHKAGAQVSLQTTSFGKGLLETETPREINEVSRGSEGTRGSAKEVATRISVELLAGEVGELEIPAQNVRVAFLDRVSSFETDVLPITVKAMAGDGTQVPGGQEQAGQAKTLPLEDVLPPVSVTRRDFTMLWVALTVLLLALMSFVALKVFRRRKPNVDIQTGSSALIPPLQEALSALASLAKSKKVKSPEERWGFFEMSEILRRYLSRRFLPSAPDSTTEEIAKDFSAIKLPASQQELVVGWLSRADLVKFANLKSSPEKANEEVLALRYILDTLEKQHHLQTSPTVIGAAEETGGENEKKE